MARLIDPKFMPRPDQIALLQAAVRRDLDGTSGGPTRSERTRTSGEIGEASVLSLLQPLVGPEHSVVDANTLRKNHPGFDYLIDDHLRIQVKCSTYVECLQTSFGAAIQTEFDVLIIVDVGCMLDANFGKHAGKRIPRSSFVEFYVLPQPIVMNFLRSPDAILNKKGGFIYLYREWKRREMKTSTKEFRGQFFDLTKWHDAWHVIESAL